MLEARPHVGVPTTPIRHKLPLIQNSKSPFSLTMCLYKTCTLADVFASTYTTNLHLFAATNLALATLFLWMPIVVMKSFTQWRKALFIKMRQVQVSFLFI